MIDSPTEALAAAALLGVPAATDNDVVEKIRNGLPSHTLTRIEEKLGITRKDLASALKIPLRTFARRRAVKGARAATTARLPKGESDLVYRLARLYNFAVDALGGDEAAGLWLKTMNPALGNVPLQMLDTEVGTREVENVLGRIRFGDTFV